MEASVAPPGALAATLVDGHTADAGGVLVPALDGRQTCFLATVDQRDVEGLPDDVERDLTVLNRINDLRNIDAFFRAVNRKLPEGGYYTGCAQTSDQYLRRLLHRYPRWFAYLFFAVIFIVKRVLPKLRATETLYFALTKGRNRVLSETEVLGRLVYCGFDIVDYQEAGDELYFIAQKARPPMRHASPSWGPLLKIRRVGQGGRTVVIYKLRTMHPYAEYLQAFVYQRQRLQPNGKLADDFRIAAWGRVLRRLWIDELPMLVNWLRGDVKLVGVRPLSPHYLSLYPEALVQRRLRHKPGLIPPFYADLPNGFDEILASEARYLAQYEASPRRTDLRYFCRAVYNIGVRRARSA